jgi:hypothetical protein
MVRADGHEHLRAALRSAIATEHQLHERAAAEEAAGQRWEARVALAQGKEALDLAEAARGRAAEHHRRARAYRAESARQQAYIARLKAELLQPTVASAPRRVAMDDDLVRRRLEALEWEDRLERDLAELKHRLGRQ